MQPSGARMTRYTINHSVENRGEAGLGRRWGGERGRGERGGGGVERGRPEGRPVTVRQGDVS